MGNRVKGRVKKKSIKAAISSSAGSKRKLSRFGKKQKKDHAGLEASFIGRSKCLKMLQVTLKDFRRLCILKGIYPRDPVGKVSAKKKKQTLYHIKDIRAIAHEPILEKFREFRAFLKKVRRAAGRNESDEAIRKNALMPTYTLHHLVKERYPRFVDALGDLDDALTLSYLFAALPAQGDIKASVISSAKSLVAAWGAYCATTCSITKAFISVKGVYLEANVQGTPVRWLVPHSFTQYLPEDVDFRVMMTFFEFYEVLLKFVLFKLYGDIGVKYPFALKQLSAGTVGSTAAVLGEHLKLLQLAIRSKDGAVGAVVSASLDQSSNDMSSSSAKKRVESAKTNKEMLKKVDAALHTLQEEESDDEEEEQVDISGQLQAALHSMEEDKERALPGGELDDEGLKRKRLFAGLTFFFSREIPRGYLELVCMAYGGKVGWEGDDSPIAMNDSSITHHIVDRPKLPASYDSLPKSREYVQPQWIVDCSNNLFLLPTTRYVLGATLPPHLSPWVDDEEEGYKPAYAEEIEKLKNGEIVDMDIDEAVHMEEEGNDDDDDDDDEVDEDQEAASEEDKDEDGEQSEEEEEEDDEQKAKRAERQRRKAEEEAHTLAKTMMNRKATHLYNRMQHGIAKKKAAIEELQKRRKEIESTKEKDQAGTTVLKQKVERLKKERKSIEDAYADTGGSMKKRSKKSKSR